MSLGCLLIGSVLPLWVLFSLFMNFPFNQKKKKKKKKEEEENLQVIYNAYMYN